MNVRIIICGWLVVLSASCTDHFYQNQLPPNDRRTVVRGDTLYSFAVAATEPTVNPQSDVYYTWYFRNDLSATQGGYEGVLLQGPYTKMLRDNTLLEKGQFDEGRKDGQWMTWQPNGAIEDTKEWNRGKRKGERQTYDEQGNLKQSRSYRKGELHGEETIYLPFPEDTHKTKHVRNWQEGQLTGRFTIYDSLDRLYQQGNYQDGKLDGKVTTHEYYAPVGQRPYTVKQVNTYRQGQPHGWFTERYSDGHVRREGRYQYGILDGSVTSYEVISSSEQTDQATYVKQIYGWKDEQHHGSFTEYYDNGRVQRQGSYRHGQLHGKLTLWDEEGEKTVQYYEDGQPVDRQKFSEKVRSFISKFKREEKPDDANEVTEHLPNE